MSDFIDVPIVESTNVENTDSGSPFIINSLTVQKSTLLSRGVAVGAKETGIMLGRVGDSLYAISINPSRIYVWYPGNNFTNFYDTEPAINYDISYVYITRIKRDWNIELTDFQSIENLLEQYYNTIIFPDNPPQSGDIVIVVAASDDNVNDFDVKINAYIDGAEFINVNINAETIDPNNSGGNSIPSFPEGTFDDTSDPIPIPVMPNISATNSGLCALFRPTHEQLESLASYLWTNITDFIDNINKLFANPMDYLIALNIFPCNPPVKELRPIKIGSWLTNIEMPPLVSQWYEFDCGKINISEYWGSALDYAPNTKVSLFLPFIGSVTLNTDEVMGRTLGVVYRIDLLSGQCVAMVTVSSLTGQTDSVYYQFTGECSVSVPLTGADWSRIYSATIGAIGTAITGGIAAGAAGAAAGNATSAMAGAKAADAASNAGLAYSMINDTSKGIRGVAQMRQDMLDASRMALEAGKQAASVPARVAKSVQAVRIANTVNNVLGTVMSGKVMAQHSGSISGSAGMLGVKTPYVLIEYPRQSLADNYKHFVGYPSNMYAKLGDLSGYTECEQVIANGLTGQTDAEMAEIIESLKGGVYL